MLTLIALAYNSKGDAYRFMQYQNQSVEIQERIGEEAGLTDSYMSLGQLYDGTGNYRKALEFYDKSLALAKPNGYRLAQLDLEALLAQVHVNLDEFDEAIAFYDPALKHKSQDDVQFNISGVAYCYQLKGDCEQALLLYDRALQAHKRQNTVDVRFEANMLLRSAECSIALGDWERASALLSQADKIFQTIEIHSAGGIEPAMVRAEIARHEGRHEQGLQYLAGCPGNRKPNLCFRQLELPYTATSTVIRAAL